MKEPHSGADRTDQDRLLEIIRQLVSEAHSRAPKRLTMHTSFERELELDSLARAELFLRIGQAFHADLPAEAWSEIETPHDLLVRLRQSVSHPMAAPSTLRDAHAPELPIGTETLVQVLEWHAARQPERTHILLYDDQAQERTIRYQDLLEGARSIAAGLLDKGLQPRQAVALMLPTGVDYLDCFFGVMIAGGIPVPIYPPARFAQIEDHLKRHSGILGNAQAAFIITVEQAQPIARRLQAAVPSLGTIVTPDQLRLPALGWSPSLSSRDIAFLQYTSGSTGDPKGVVLTHANLLANIGALGQAAQATPDDVFVSWLPLYHDMGLIGAWFGSLYHAIPLVLMSPLSFLARPARWLETISRHRGTISAAPNFAYELCIRHVSAAALDGIDLSSWRLALNGAEPVIPATLDAFAERFSRCGLRREAITPVYGLAESSVGLAFPPLERGPRIDALRREPFAREARAVPAGPGDADPIRVACCGRPLRGHEIRIVDDAEVELPQRRIGRLEFRGPSATSGYYRNPAASAGLFRGSWLDSGDYAYMAEGEVYIAGRVKDLIKRGGRNLYPYDLEEAAGNLPGIRKGCVAVFASPDPASGSERLVIMAETRARDESERERLQQELNRTAIEVVGAPADDVVLVAPHTVLKTSSGKIRRLACKQLYESGMQPQSMALPGLRTARFALSQGIASARVAARRMAVWVYGGYAWFVLALLAFPIGVGVLLLRQPARARRLVRIAARTLFALLGVSIRVKGIERLPRAPHILLVNHASYLDAIVLSALLDPEPGHVFTAKKEFTEQFIMRSLLASVGTLFIERADIRKSAQEVDAMADALERGTNVIVFPEGTFTREAGIRPFHLGGFIAAARRGAPVVVAAVRGTRSALRAGTWLPRPAAIEFEVGPVLIPASQEWSTAVKLSTQARAEMAQLAGEFVLP
jgi:1-acyl-sn-glycerol-3-phosphate acyltransferase